MSELYELPEGWEWKKLTEVVKIGCDKGFKPIISDGKVPFIGMTDIDEDKGRNSKYVLEDYEKVSKGKTKFQKNAVLVGKITPCTQNNKTTIVPSDIDGGFATTEVYALHTMDNMTPLYLNYFIRSNKINEYLVSTMIGATGRQRVPSDTIKNLDIPLPPLSEQQRIVSKLDLLFEKIDKSIALHQKNMDEANAFMGSVLNDVFGELEEKYLKIPFFDIADVNRGKSKHRPRNDKKLFGGPYPFIQTGDVRNANKYIDTFTETYSEFGLSQSRLWGKGTICMTIAANIGDVAILGIDSCFPDSVVGIYSENNSNDFIYYFLLTLKQQLESEATTTAQMNINLKVLQTIDVPLPPLNIQQKVVKYLDEISQKIEKIKQAQKAKMNSLKALKASILDQAFKGEL